jgi:hypothetical protein
VDELAALLGHDEVGLAEQIEMIRNAGQAHDKMAADFADGQFLFAENFEDAATGGIIEGAEKLGHNI